MGSPVLMFMWPGCLTFRSHGPVPRWAATACGPMIFVFCGPAGPRSFFAVENQKARRRYVCSFFLEVGDGQFNQQ